MQTSYRREVLLARNLAENGIAVQRFHYRGSGNSDGSPEQETFIQLKDDTLRAAGHLRTITGVARLGFIGTRLGGHIAAAAASVVSPGGPLVIISPVPDTQAYFREVLRGYLFGLLKENGGAARSAQALLDDLRARGSLDVLGYPLTWALYESFAGRSLRDLLALVDGPALLLPESRAGGSLPDSLQGIDARAEIRAIAGQEVWWFGGGVSLRRGEASTTDDMVRAVKEWIGHLLVEGVQ
jgi:hypothetical protein